MKRESAKHAAYREELAEARDRVLMRSHGVCERCGRQRIEVIHHILRRSQGGTNDPENLAGLCSDCHGEIHDHPKEAYEDGWLTKSGPSVHNVGTKEAG